MNTALTWIKAYVPELECTDQEYCDAMTLSGTKVEGFEKLDKEKPYDNGLSYKDVNKTESVSCGDEGLVLHLICRFDGIKNIVKIVKFED